VDQQANRRARSAPGATLNPGRLNGSQGVTTFLKVTAPGCRGSCGLVLRIPAAPPALPQGPGSLAPGTHQWCPIALLGPSPGAGFWFWRGSVSDSLGVVSHHCCQKNSSWDHCRGDQQTRVSRPLGARATF